MVVRQNQVLVAKGGKNLKTTHKFIHKSQNEEEEGWRKRKKKNKGGQKMYKYLGSVRV